MDEEKSFRPWIIFLSILGLIVVSVVWYFSTPPAERNENAVRRFEAELPPAGVKNPLAGKWRNGELGTLIVYPDRWASANGIECPWELADESAIRIELDLKKTWARLPNLTVTGDFRLRPASAGRQAVLNFLGTDYLFERSEYAGPGRELAQP